MARCACARPFGTATVTSFGAVVAVPLVYGTRFRRDVPQVRCFALSVTAFEGTGRVVNWARGLKGPPITVGAEALMKHEIEAAFAEMLDISTDIDKAVVFGPEGVVASNMTEPALSATVAQAEALVDLGQENASKMGSQPLTQLVVETADGLVFLVRETAGDGMTAVATGKKGSRVGLVLYDLKTCLRDAREAAGDTTTGGEA
jgi:predicted regulator of Ras-like GTPase activity (Roadblock/LC7/MglB family)